MKLSTNRFVIQIHLVPDLIPSQELSFYVIIIIIISVGCILLVAHDVNDQRINISTTPCHLFNSNTC